MLVNDPDFGPQYAEVLEQGTFLLEKYINISLVNNLPNDSLGNYLSDLAAAGIEDTREYTGKIAPQRANELWSACKMHTGGDILSSNGFEVNPSVFLDYFKSWKYGLRLSYAPASDLAAVDWMNGQTGDSPDEWVVGGSAANEFYDTI